MVVKIHSPSLAAATSWHRRRMIRVSWPSSRPPGTAVVRQAWQHRQRPPGGVEGEATFHPSRLIPASSQGADTARFQHARHDALTCTTCHSTRSGHGDLKRSVARDCQGCHHGNTPTGRDCARCHSSGEIGQSRVLAARVALTVWPQPRERALSFSHDRHTRLPCANCHAGARQKTIERDCSSCHADHHGPDRNCASCHPPARESHARSVHATGCATSGCHERERGTAVSPVRATCLLCHAEQRDHKAGRECAPCHLSAWTGPASRERPWSGRACFCYR